MAHGLVNGEHCELDYKAGDLVRFITGEGPLLVVEGPVEPKEGDAGPMLACGYYNPVKGEFYTTNFTLGLLKPAE